MRALLLICFLYSFNANAFEMPNIKESLRPLLVQMIGADLASKFLGNPLAKYTLPELPSLASSNLEVRPEITGANVKIPKDQRQKLDYIFIRDLYSSVLLVKANDNDFAQWMNVLDQGGGREGIYSGIVLSDSYAGLEELNQAPTEDMIKFIKSYLKTYIGKDYTVEQLSSFNPYSLKRIIVDQSLNILGGFHDRPKDLILWYGIMSAELARDYGHIFKGKIRSNTDVEAQLRWAGNVPFEFIQSELIIKLHRVINSLMN